MRFKVDKLDMEIISELIEDAKTPTKELAKKLNIHPNTLLQRVKRLEGEGAILRYTIVPDYEKLGFEFYAVISIKTKMQKGWEERLKPLAQLPEIVSFLLVTGESDALAIARMRSKKDLTELLRKLQDSNVVEKTMTYLILDGYKFPHEFNPFKGMPAEEHK